VERFGLRGGRHPVAFSFAYSRALGGQCTDATCARPYLVDLGSLGFDMELGCAGLVDMNGDALPDVVRASGSFHEIHYNVLAADGTQALTPASVSDWSSAALQYEQVQLLDSNGDGFADLVDALNNAVLINHGAGDWVRSDAITTDDLATVLEGNLNFRFFDWDNDKQIDIVMSPDENSTAYYTNAGGGSFVHESGVFQPIGAGFQSDHMRLEDMNGDGMLDAV
jgi:hypothetical protein